MSDYRKEYQVKDAEGNPVGKPQVFEGDSWEEVADKIASAHEQASRRILELRGRIPQSKPEEAFKFEAKDLTPDEKFKLSNDISDPQLLDATIDKLLESRLGAPVDRIRKSLNRIEEMEQIERARLEAQKFLNRHPEFKPCGENESKMVAYIQTNNLGYNCDNLEVAMDALADQLVFQSPEPQPSDTDEATESINSHKVEQPISSRPANATAATRGKAPTQSLFSHNSGPAGNKGKGGDAALQQEISKMSAAEFRRRVSSDPAFAAKVNGTQRR